MDFEHVMRIARKDRSHVMTFVPNPKIAVECRRTSVTTFDSLKKWSPALYVWRFCYGTKPAVASLGEGRRWPRPEVSLCNPNVQLAVVASAIYRVNILRGMHSRYLENTDRAPIRSVMRLDKSLVEFVPLDLRVNWCTAHKHYYRGQNP
jgi:hypothetical protein